MSYIEGILIQIFNYVGSLVCHQIPDRTLWIGGHYLPVCARDTGAYLGFYVGYLLLHFRNRKATGPPNLWITLLMVMPITMDGFSQWLGFRTSTNEIRLATGLLFGISMAPLLVYLLSTIPTGRKIPLIRTILPLRTELDNLRDPWLGSRAYASGMVAITILFFVINALVGSTNIVFYWLISSLIVISVIAHILILPIFVLISIIIMKKNAVLSTR